MINTKINITYSDIANGEKLDNYLLAFTYNDREDGKQDDINITLQDTNGDWKGKLLPNKGAIITAKIEQLFSEQLENGMPKKMILDCGSFEIDEIELSGPPSICIIKAVSIPVDSCFRKERVTKGWENINLKNILQEIANKSQLDLYYQSDIDPFKIRWDQREESDASFVYRLCNKYGLKCKASFKHLVVTDYIDNKKDSSLTIDYKESKNLINYSLKTKIDSIYRGFEVMYWDSHQHKFYSISRLLEDSQVAKTSDAILKINQYYESLEEAINVGRQKLIQANCKERTASLTILGNTEVHAGNNINLINFGELSGLYSIAGATHNYTNTAGYTTSLELVTAEQKI